MAVVKKVKPGSAPVKKKTVEAAPTTAFALATDLTVPSDALRDYSILMFGEKKIGKSSLASMFDGAYFFAAEPGHKALSVYKSDIHDWKTFKAAVRAWRKDTRFKTAIVDTVDLLFKMCEDHVCRELGVDHVSEADWGKGWSALRTEFEKTMRDLMSAPNKGTVLISHSTEREVKKRSGEKYHRIQPTMPGTARDIIESMVDIWCYFAYDDDRRTLTIRGDDLIAAGHRLQDRFRWKGQEVVVIDMGLTKEEGYRNFLAAFNNQYEIAAVVPPPPSAPIKKKVKK